MVAIAGTSCSSSRMDRLSGYAEVRSVYARLASGQGTLCPLETLPGSPCSSKSPDLATQDAACSTFRHDITDRLPADFRSSLQTVVTDCLKGDYYTAAADLKAWLDTNAGLVEATTTSSTTAPSTAFSLTTTAQAAGSPPLDQAAADLWRADPHTAAGTVLTVSARTRATYGSAGSSSAVSPRRRQTLDGSR
jgi:hypothetical protein